jgi:hypothetical protein
MQLYIALSIRQLLCRLSEAGQSTDFCSRLTSNCVQSWTVRGMHLNRIMNWLLPIICYLQENSHWCATRCTGNCCTANRRQVINWQNFTIWLVNLLELSCVEIFRVPRIYFCFKKIIFLYQWTSTIRYLKRGTVSLKTKLFKVVCF